MANAPANPHTETARRTPRLIVRLGPEDGTSPAEDDEATWLRPLEIVRAAGGRQLDYARFAVDLGATGERLQDLQTPEGWNRQIEVWIASDEEEDTPETPLFWGELCVQNVAIAPGDETAQIAARVEPYHFGLRISGYRVRNPQTEETTTIQEDIYFNPLVDGKICVNRSSHEDPDHDFYLWIDPESGRTEESLEYHDDVDSTFWTLGEAVYTLCWFLNPTEALIDNPTREDVEAWIDDHEPPALFNVRIPRGLSLPEALDLLLEPYGFGWFLAVDSALEDPEDEDSDRVMQPKITVFKRGDGDEREVFLQAIGEELAVAESNLAEFALTTSVADLANQVDGYGSLEQQEFTIELKRGWPEAADGKTDADLSKQGGSEYEANPHAWRLWIANEAGDYTGTRPEITGVLDLRHYFTDPVPRRRFVDDCLTKDANGRRRPPLIQYWDPDAGEDGDWKEVTSGGVSVLRDQIGVMFTGTKPPDEIVVAGSEARVRITGTLTGDQRLFARASKRNTSPAGRTIVLKLDLSDRFHARSVCTLGPLASVLAGDPHGAFTADDREDLQEFVERIRDVEDSALMQAQLGLHGLHFDYEIAQQITRVAGRNISLNRNAEAAETKRYLQVTAVRYDVQQQRTELRVEALRDTGFTRSLDFGSFPL